MVLRRSAGRFLRGQSCSCWPSSWWFMTRLFYLQWQYWNSHEETPIEALQQSFDNYQPEVKSFDTVLNKGLDPLSEINAQKVVKKCSSSSSSPQPRKYVCTFQGNSSLFPFLWGKNQYNFLFRLWQKLYKKFAPQSAYSNPHWRATFRLWFLHLEIFKKGRIESAYKKTYWTKTISVQIVCQVICSIRSFGRSCQTTQHKLIIKPANKNRENENLFTPLAWPPECWQKFSLHLNLSVRRTACALCSVFLEFITLNDGFRPSN